MGRPHPRVAHPAQCALWPATWLSVTNDASTRDRQILPANLPAEPSRPSVRHIWRDFVVGLAITASLVLLQVVVGHREFGKQLEQMTYSMLQVRMLSSSGWRDLPVTVVDISGLTPVPIQSAGKTELATPRGPLLDLVEAVAQQRPRAIGIDLDFSPTTHGYVTPSDHGFLESLLKIRGQGTPVYVGIYDSVVLCPKRWLGEEQFQPLAAYISVPKPEGREPSRRMVEWVWPAGVSERCDSLAYALVHTEQAPIPRLWRWGVRRADEKKKPKFSASDFLVDYGPLESLMSQRLPADNAGALINQRSRIAGKIVLLGRASPGQSTDQFNIPGRGMPVPGVYLHATAAYTLLEAPLYELTPCWGRVTADVLAALMVFGSILVVRLYHSVRLGSDVAAHRLHVMLTAVVIVAVLMVGHFLVNTIRLIWIDYLMVIAGLLLHSPAERLVTQTAGRLRGRKGVVTHENSDGGHGDDTGGPGDTSPAAPGGEA